MDAKRVSADVECQEDGVKVVPACGSCTRIAGSRAYDWAGGAERGGADFRWRVMGSTQESEVHPGRGKRGLDAREGETGAVGHCFKALRNHGSRLRDTGWILLYSNWRHLDVLTGEWGHWSSPQRRGVWCAGGGRPPELRGGDTRDLWEAQHLGAPRSLFAAVPQDASLLPVNSTGRPGSCPYILH